LDVDNDAWEYIIVGEIHAIRLCYYALTVVVTKKATNCNRQDMLKVIQHALTVAKL
jgi:hypothetical protein